MVALGIFTAVFAYKDLMWPLICNKRCNASICSTCKKCRDKYTSKLSSVNGSISACMYPDDRTVPDLPENSSSKVSQTSGGKAVK